MLKSRGFRRPELPPRSRPALVPLAEPSRAVMVTTARPHVSMAKQTRHESEDWRRAVASLRCVRCGREGDTQCAHRNEGKGMGLKTDDALTAALCSTCHSEIDQGKDMTRDERRDAIDQAILLTVRELARRGLIRAVAMKGLV